MKKIFKKECLKPAERNHTNRISNINNSIINTCGSKSKFSNG